MPKSYRLVVKDSKTGKKVMGFKVTPDKTNTATRKKKATKTKAKKASTKRKRAKTSGDSWNAVQGSSSNYKGSFGDWKL
jgi:hypothetical protein